MPDMEPCMYAAGMGADGVCINFKYDIYLYPPVY